MENLKELGWNDWFSDRVDSEKATAHRIGRVVSVHRDSYVVTSGKQEMFAECSGNLLYASDSPLDLPTTGDWVYADYYDDDTHAIIHGVLPRKTLLKRKTAGKRVDVQLIAANIDVAFVMQSADFNFNPGRLERYLAMVNESGITPVILLSKSDLLAADALAEMEETLASVSPATTIQSFSNQSGDNLDIVEALLEPGRTCCLIGSSGVGKTTLLNRLTGSEQFTTQEVSRKESKGRHTTTARELVMLENRALLIDTPGMRELGNLGIDSGIDETFTEITDLASQCRFRDCSHSAEKGCAVRAAIATGELDERRYRNYLKLKSESAFYDMSYSEKRQKDRAFGKMVKSVLKDKQKYR